ncbi:MAG: HEAT repeat domain-containing protein, partial [Planctomycetota bacterium]
IRTSDSSLVNLRASAILALGLFAERQDEIVAFLYKQLADSGMDRSTCAQIPIALSRLGKAAQPTLPKLLALLRARRTDIRLQESCVIALGRLTEPADAAVLEALYETIQYGKNPQARHFAFEALARIGARAARDPRAYDAELKQMLRFLRQELNRPKIRPHSPWASLALAELGREYPETSGDRVESTLEIIERFERSDNPSYKSAYAISLGLLEARNAGDILYQELLDTPNPNLRGYLAVALGMLRHTEALPILRQMVLDSRDPRAQLQCATALGLMEDTEALPLLLDALRQARTLGVISSLARAIGKLGDRSAIPTLKGMIEDESLNGLSRAYCCVALGLISQKTGSSWTARITDGVNYRTALPFLYEIMDMP